MEFTKKELMLCLVILVALLLGWLVGFYQTGNKNIDNQCVADRVEDLVFNNTQVHFLNNENITFGRFKQLYYTYHMPARGLLESQIDRAINACTRR